MTKEFTLRGEWFLPSSKDQRVHGVLTYHPKEGTSLELYGSLDGENFIPELKNQQIILGLTSDSKQVTLCNCFMTKAGGAAQALGEESDIHWLVSMEKKQKT